MKSKKTRFAPEVDVDVFVVVVVEVVVVVDFVVEVLVEIWGSNSIGWEVRIGWPLSSLLKVAVTISTVFPFSIQSENFRYYNIIKYCPHS